MTDSGCMKQCFDSNTKTVLLSTQCFSKIYQNGITFKSNIFKVIVSKWLFEVLLNWRCLSKQWFDSNTKTVLLSKYCFSKIYQNGITSKSNIFKVIVSKWLFEVLLNWRCLSKQCFDSNTKTVLLSKRCFSKKYHNGITVKSVFFEDLPEWYRFQI